MNSNICLIFFSIVLAVKSENTISTTISPNSTSIVTNVTTTAPKSSSIVTNVTTTAPKSSSIVTNVTTTVPKSSSITTKVTTTAPKSQFVKCDDPSSEIGKKIRGESGVDGVALIKKFCPKLKTESPYFDWKRGENVVEKCSEIPHLTPIATFLSPAKAYGGDSAIFDSCDNQTVVKVFYQNNTQPIEHRIFELRGDPVNNAKYYYTINP